MSRASVVAVDTLDRLEQQARAAASAKENKARRMSTIFKDQLKEQIEEFYSKEAKLARLEMFQDPRVQKQLHRLWTSINDSDDAVMSKAEYLVMHHKMLLWLDPSIEPEKSSETAEQDWNHDSGGLKCLDKARTVPYLRFCRSVEFACC